MADKFDANSWDKSPSYQNGGDVPWSRGIDLTPEQKMIAGKNIGIVTDAQIDSLIDQFHDLDGRVNVALDNVDTALETVSSLSGDVESALTGAQQALDTVNTITANFDVLSGKVDSNAANISSNSADISTNSSNIGTLSAKEQIDRTDINAISGNVDTNAYNIGNLSAKVNTISGNVSTLQYDVSSIKIDITGMNSRLNTVSGIADNALASGQDALNKANAISAQWTIVSGDIEDLKDDWSAFSATEDAVITAATAAIPGQVSAEVSGQLSGKQDKLTHGENISLTTAGVIDVNHVGGDMVGSIPGVILGYNCSAGNHAFAAGSQTLASGIQSFSIGANTRALGNQSFVAGTGCSGIGAYSHAEGSNTMTLAPGAHAEGYATSAIGNNSHAEGNYAVAAGWYSHAEGVSTTATYQYSHVEGRYTISDTIGQHVEGQYNAPATGALHVIGNGTSTAQRSNVWEVYTDRVNVNGDLNVASYNINRQLGDIGTILANYEYDKVSRSIMISNNNVSVNTPFSDYPLYSLGDYSIYEGPTYINSPVSYLNLSDSNGRAVAIEKWKGDLQRILYYGNGNYNKVSAWPSVLPVNITNLQRFAGNNPYVTDVSAQFTNLSSKVNMAKDYMFQGCINITADIVPIMDSFTAEDASRHVGMFRGCTAIPNYSTLTADPTYSAFF